MQGMNGMGGMMAACMGMMMPLAFAAWVAVALAAVYVIRRLSRQPQLMPSGGAAAVPALATLRERFARGEIDRAEYEERRRLLSSDERGWP